MGKAKIFDMSETKDCNLGSVMPCYSKQDVIELVAEFACNYDTGMMGYHNRQEAKDDGVSELIKWDLINKA